MTASVLASNRGALPEVLSRPASFSTCPRSTPRFPAGAFRPTKSALIATIIRLWDDPAFYRASDNVACAADACARSDWFFS